MNLNYAIFRSEPIYTLQDLAQIGSHNKREKLVFKSNPDIKLELKDNNINFKILEEDKERTLSKEIQKIINVNYK